MNNSAKTISLYIHYPFCRRICHYCDFYKIKYSKSEEKIFCKNLITEFNYLKEIFLDSFKVDTIYIGGGSPSVGGKVFFETCEYIIKTVKLTRDPEISIELNPEDLSDDLIKKLNSLPINRVSLGIQSFNQSVLEFLHRGFDYSSLENYYYKLRELTSNISFDILFGFHPNLYKKHLKNISSIKGFKPEHISLYALTVYEGTPLYKTYKTTPHLVVEEEVYKQYKELVGIFKDWEYQHYEISNFAKHGYKSRHNLHYWLFHNYLGLGPSAASKFGNLHWKNLYDYNKYNSTLRNGAIPIDNFERLEGYDVQFERLFLRMRLRNRIQKNYFFPEPLSPENDEKITEFFFKFKEK